MSAPNDVEHIEELLAGRVLGDLSPEEETELRELCQRDDRPIDDASLEATAAGLGAALANQDCDEMPASLKAAVQADAREFTSPASPEPDSNVISLFGSIFRSPITGWAAAALLMLTWIIRTQLPAEGDPSRAIAQLSRQNDLIQEEFNGQAIYSSLKGDVLWSSELQQGYMRLTGLPANDPAKAQYQLWIVDPQRDADSPVDGGVFDISASGENLIPIDAKLAIGKPAAFVITLEQPGGVVKSKQEIVVAAAML